MMGLTLCSSAVAISARPAGAARPCAVAPAVLRAAAQASALVLLAAAGRAAPQVSFGLGVPRPRRRSRRTLGGEGGRGASSPGPKLYLGIHF